MSDLTGKVIVITGASSGIGEGIALYFAKLGARLTLTGRDKERLSAVATDCNVKGLDDSKILCIDGDIASKSLRESLVKNTVEKFGCIDVLNDSYRVILHRILLFLSCVSTFVAGMMNFGSTSTLPEDQFDRMMDVNVRSVFYLTQLAIPELKKSKGNVINMSSVGSHSPIVGVTAYSMSKAALDMFTKCLSLELASSGVRVNSINPGPVYSRLAKRENSPIADEKVYQQVMTEEVKKIPLGRIGEPEDVPKAVAFLASNEQSSFVTGDIMFIGGACQFAYHYSG